MSAMDNPQSPISPSEPTAVLYLRVSTKGQVATDFDPEGISIPAQRKACLQKAAQLGARVVETYIEPGKTATTMDKRPAFQEMLERIRTQKDVTYVIVYKLSRMNRNRVDDALVLASLRKYKATLISATESIDETPVGQLMHGILAAFNEYRSAEDGADIRYKMRQKATSGGTLGKAPLGYLNVRERFEGREVRTVALDPERAPLIKLGFELYSTGTYGLQALADELTARGLRTRPGRYPAGPVSDSKIHKMLSDPYYLGVVTADGAQYPGRHEPLVSPELFAKVQTALATHSTAGERRRTLHHFLKGSLSCARCHARGTQTRLIYTEATNPSGATYDYFKCIRRGKGCDLPHLAAHLVEDAITAFWRTQRLPQTFIAQVRADLKDVLREEATSRHLLHEQLTTELARIDRQEENLIDLAANATDTSNNARIRTRITELHSRRQELKARLEDTGERLQQGADVLNTQLDLLERPDELYRRLPRSGKRQLNQAVFEQLLVDLDPEDPDVTIAGQNYTDPVHDLMTAAHPEQASKSSKRDRGTVIDGPSVAFSAGRMEHDTCSNKAPLVELRGFEPLTPSMPWRCATSCATAPPREQVPREAGPSFGVMKLYRKTGGQLQIEISRACRSRLIQADAGRCRPTAARARTRHRTRTTVISVLADGGLQRSTRAPPPAASLSTSAFVAIDVSPGVVIARAP
ncbi:recombinase [Kineosporia sp. NBRC 101731]|nr:recombinase [Kineosporia sp. NBRC 101731]